MTKEGGTMIPVWPEDGAIISPVFMLTKAEKYQNDNIRVATNYDEFRKILETHRGFVKVFWNQDKDIEAKIKLECKCVSRCMPLDQTGETSVDFMTGEPSTTQWLFAPAY